MGGSDEVGVDPGRVSQAAGALANLRDVLAANVPTIVNIMNEYWSSGAGSPVSLAVLHQAQSRSVDDVTQMQTRAQLAEAWLAQGVSLTGSGMVTIPFSGPVTIRGTAAALREQMDRYAQAGVDEFILPDWNTGTGAARKDFFDWFASEVAAGFRQNVP